MLVFLTIVGKILPSVRAAFSLRLLETLHACKTPRLYTVYQRCNYIFGT